MAIVEKIVPEPQPEIVIKLTVAEATALVTLLGSGVDSAALRTLGLEELNTQLHLHAKEARNAAFGYCTEVEYYYPNSGTEWSDIRR